MKKATTWSIVLGCTLTLLATVIQAAEFTACTPPVAGCLCTGGNQIKCTGPSVTSCPPVTNSSITYFTFDNCELGAVTTIPYSQATMITFKTCNIKSFDPKSFNLTSKLQHLHIRNNPLLSALPDRLFYNLNSMTMLDISDSPLLSTNGLTKDLFSHTENVIEKVVLNRIGLQRVPTELLGSFVSLQKLYLDGNSITKLEDSSFPPLGEMAVLDMNKNQISSISDGAFKKTPALTFLNLDANRLSEVGENVFSPLESLTQLCLSGNMLRTLSDLSSKQWLKNLGLKDNKWQCDCNIQWMGQYNLDKACNDVTQEVTCTEPEEYAGYTIGNITATMQCPTKGNDRVAMIVAIPIIIICSLLIIYFLYRIIQNKRKAGRRKAVRYSAVYKETTEAKDAEKAKKPLSEL